MSMSSDAAAYLQAPASAPTPVEKQACLESPDGLPDGVTDMMTNTEAEAEADAYAQPGVRRQPTPRRPRAHSRVSKRVQLTGNPDDGLPSSVTEDDDLETEGKDEDDELNVDINEIEHLNAAEAAFEMSSEPMKLSFDSEQVLNSTDVETTPSTATAVSPTPSSTKTTGAIDTEIDEDEVDDGHVVFSRPSYEEINEEDDEAFALPQSSIAMPAKSHEWHDSVTHHPDHLGQPSHSEDDVGYESDTASEAMEVMSETEDNANEEEDAELLSEVQRKRDALVRLTNQDWRALLRKFGPSLRDLFVFALSPADVLCEHERRRAHEERQKALRREAAEKSGESVDTDDTLSPEEIQSKANEDLHTFLAMYDSLHQRRKMCAKLEQDWVSAMTQIVDPRVRQEMEDLGETQDSLTNKLDTTDAEASVTLADLAKGLAASQLASFGGESDTANISLDLINDPEMDSSASTQQSPIEAFLSHQDLASKLSPGQLARAEQFNAVRVALQKEEYRLRIKILYLLSPITALTEVLERDSVNDLGTLALLAVQDARAREVSAQALAKAQERMLRGEVTPPSTPPDSPPPSPRTWSNVQKEYAKAVAAASAALAAEAAASGKEIKVSPLQIVSRLPLPPPMPRAHVDRVSMSELAKRKHRKAALDAEAAYRKTRQEFPAEYTYVVAEKKKSRTTKRVRWRDEVAIQQREARQLAEKLMHEVAAEEAAAKASTESVTTEGDDEMKDGSPEPKPVQGPAAPETTIVQQQTVIPTDNTSASAADNSMSAGSSLVNSEAESSQVLPSSESVEPAKSSESPLQVNSLGSRDAGEIITKPAAMSTDISVHGAMTTMVDQQVPELPGDDMTSSSSSSREDVTSSVDNADDVVTAVATDNPESDNQQIVEESILKPDHDKAQPMDTQVINDLSLNSAPAALVHASGDHEADVSSISSATHMEQKTPTTPPPHTGVPETQDIDEMFTPETASKVRETLANDFVDETPDSHVETMQDGAGLASPTVAISVTSTADSPEQRIDSDVSPTSRQAQDEIKLATSENLVKFSDELSSTEMDVPSRVLEAAAAVLPAEANDSTLDVDDADLSGMHASHAQVSTSGAEEGRRLLSTLVAERDHRLRVAGAIATSLVSSSPTSGEHDSHQSMDKEPSDGSLDNLDGDVSGLDDEAHGPVPVKFNFADDDDDDEVEPDDQLVGPGGRSHVSSSPLQPSLSPIVSPTSGDGASDLTETFFGQQKRRRSRSVSSPTLAMMNTSSPTAAPSSSPKSPTLVRPDGNVIAGSGNATENLESPSREHLFSPKRFALDRKSRLVDNQAVSRESPIEPVDDQTARSLIPQLDDTKVSDNVSEDNGIKSLDLELDDDQVQEESKAAHASAKTKASQLESTSQQNHVSRRSGPTQRPSSSRISEKTDSKSVPSRKPTTSSTTSTATLASTPEKTSKALPRAATSKSNLRTTPASKVTGTEIPRSQTTSSTTTTVHSTPHSNGRQRCEVSGSTSTPQRISKPTSTSSSTKSHLNAASHATPAGSTGRVKPTWTEHPTTTSTLLSRSMNPKAPEPLNKSTLLRRPGTPAKPLPSTAAIPGRRPSASAAVAASVAASKSESKPELSERKSEEVPAEEVKTIVRPNLLDVELDDAETVTTSSNHPEAACTSDTPAQEAGKPSEGASAHTTSVEVSSPSARSTTSSRRSSFVKSSADVHDKSPSEVPRRRASVIAASYVSPYRYTPSAQPSTPTSAHNSSMSRTLTSPTAATAAGVSSVSSRTHRTASTSTKTNPSSGVAVVSPPPKATRTADERTASTPARTTQSAAASVHARRPSQDVATTRSTATTTSLTRLAGTPAKTSVHTSRSSGVPTQTPRGTKSLAVSNVSQPSHGSRSGVSQRLTKTITSSAASQVQVASTEESKQSNHASTTTATASASETQSQQPSVAEVGVKDSVQPAEMITSGADVSESKSSEAKSSGSKPVPKAPTHALKSTLTKTQDVSSRTTTTGRTLGAASPAPVTSAFRSAPASQLTSPAKPTASRLSRTRALEPVPPTIASRRPSSASISAAPGSTQSGLSSTTRVASSRSSVNNDVVAASSVSIARRAAIIGAATPRRTSFSHKSSSTEPSQSTRPDWGAHNEATASGTGTSSPEQKELTETSPPAPSSPPLEAKTATVGGSSTTKTGHDKPSTPEVKKTASATRLSSTLTTPRRGVTDAAQSVRATPSRETPTKTQKASQTTAAPNLSKSTRLQSGGLSSTRTTNPTPTKLSTSTSASQSTPRVDHQLPGRSSKAKNGTQERVSVVTPVESKQEVHTENSPQITLDEAKTPSSEAISPQVEQPTSSGEIETQESPVNASIQVDQAEQVEK